MSDLDQSCTVSRSVLLGDRVAKVLKTVFSLHANRIDWINIGRYRVCKDRQTDGQVKNIEGERERERDRERKREREEEREGERVRERMSE